MPIIVLIRVDAFQGLFSKKKLKRLSLYGFGFASRNNDDKGGSAKGGRSVKGGSTKRGSVKGDNQTTPIAHNTYKTSDADLHSTLSRSTSTRDGNRSQPNFSRSTSTKDGGGIPGLSRSTSTRDGNPIRFSYSAVRRKPPPVEKTLECTLEDLCHGCVKKIMLTRDVLADTGWVVTSYIPFMDG